MAGVDRYGWVDGEGASGHRSVAVTIQLPSKTQRLWYHFGVCFVAAVFELREDVQEICCCCCCCCVKRVVGQIAHHTMGAMHQLFFHHNTKDNTTANTFLSRG